MVGLPIDTVLELSSSVSSRLRFAELLIEIEARSSGALGQTFLNLLDLIMVPIPMSSDIAQSGQYGRMCSKDSWLTCIALVVESMCSIRLDRTIMVARLKG